MNNSKTLKAILLLSGLVAIGFGATILLFPVPLHALNGVYLGNSPSLLSEIRAPGGVLLACGALIAAGAFFPRLTFTSTIVCTLTYSAYGLSRLLSILLDGVPAVPLLRAMIAELVIGAIGAVALRTALRHERLLSGTKGEVRGSQDATLSGQSRPTLAEQGATSAGQGRPTLAGQSVRMG